MRDFLSAIDEALADLGQPESASFPGPGATFPGDLPGSKSDQTIVINSFSRNFRVSRSESASSGENNRSDAKTENCPRAGAHASSYQKPPGNPGTPGNAGETLAGPSSCDFPVSLSLPENSEGNREKAGLQAPSPGDPLPISSADVRAGVARELRHLADLGVTGSEAERHAVAITRAKVGNSPALAVRQTNTGRCAVCDEPLRDAEAWLAVLNPGAAPLHLHAGCHEGHRARRGALIDKIMVAAGYGAEAAGGGA